MSYAGGICLQYKVYYLIHRSRMLLRTRNLAGSLRRGSWAVYIRYVRFAKLLLQNLQLILLLERLCEEAGMGKDLGILHQISHVLYGSVEEDVVLMAEAADVFIRSDTNTLPFHAVAVYNPAELVLTDLRELYIQHYPVEYSSFQPFLLLEWQARQGPSRSVKVLFLNNMRLFDFHL